MILFLALCSLLSRVAAAPRSSAQVVAPSGRTCDVHLHAAPDVSGLPLVAIAGGTGRYTMADHASVFSRLVADGRVAVVAFDKPGIHAESAAAGGFNVEESVYGAYTQDDLAACAVAAVGWARAQAAVDPSAPIVLFGHSEGANVMLDALGRLSATVETYVPPAGAEPSGAVRKMHPAGGPVGAVLLSGTPTEPFTEALRRQTGARWPSFRRAIEDGDDAFLIEETGVGSASLRDMSAAPGFTAHMARLAELRVSTPIFLFHGGGDAASDAAHAEDTFVARWRRVHAADRRPLDVSMRMYPACGHVTCPQMSRDLQLIAIAATEGRAPAPAPARGSGPGIVDLPVDDALLKAIPGRYALFGLLPMGSVVARGDQLVLMNRALPAVTLLHQGDGVFVFDHDPATELTFTTGPRRLTIRKSGTVLPMRRAGPPKARHARRVEGAPAAGPPWLTRSPEPTPPPVVTSDTSDAPTLTPATPDPSSSAHGTPVAPHRSLR